MGERVGLVLCLSVLALWHADSRAFSADCNANGIEDSIDVTSPSVDFELQAGTQVHVNADTLVPGDLDGDGDLDVAGTSRFQREVLVLLNDGPGRFGEKPPPLLSDRGRSIARGDLDGDGALDLAVAVDFAVELFLNDGKAVFQRRAQLRVGSNPFRVLARDVNGDGREDLVTANIQGDAGNVSVLLNEGNGQFAIPRNFASHNPGEPLLDAGDLDGDGDTDLVVGAASHTGLGILENGGSGAFSFVADLEVALGFVPRSLALGDFDGDRALDAAVTGPDGILLLRNGGGGDLGPAETLALGPRGVARVLTEDLDGDGALDLVASEGGCPTFSVFLNDGRGGFPARLAVSTRFFPRVLVAGDFSGDGAPDVAGLDDGPLRHGVAVFLQRPSTRSRDCDLDGIPDECEPDCNLNRMPDACDLLGGVSGDCDLNGVPDECDPDCDGNGKPDACDVLGGGGGLDCDSNGIPDSCELGLGDGDGNGLLDSCELARSPHLDCDGNGSLDLADLAPVFRFAQEEYAAGGAPTSVVSSDLDGDGDLDVAAANHGVPPDVFLAGRPAGITILSNRGDGTLVRAREITFDAPVIRVEALDADRDGRADLITASWDRFCSSNQGWISVLLNDGELRFTRRAAHPIESWPLSLRAADFDGDRVEEVLVATASTFVAREGIVSTLRGRGDGTYSSPVAVGPGQHAAAADLDTDGDIDVASDRGAVLLNDGDGTFQVGNQLPLAGFRIETGDLDGDGDPDLVLSENALGTNILLNDGKAAFARGGTLTLATWSDFLIVDVDSDGALDLAMTAFTGAAILRNLGGARFAPEVQYPTGSNISGLAAGDLDGDHDIDLVTANRDSSSVSVLRNAGGGSFSTRVVHAQEEGLHSLSSADMDGDGDRDLLSISCCTLPRSLVLFENDGRGGFSDRKIQIERGPASTAPADFDRDGDVDVALLEFWDESGVASLSLLLNDGGGTFRQGVRLPAGEYSSSLVGLDLEGDGDTDLVTVNAMDASVFLNPGDGGLQAGGSVPLGGGVVFLLPGDADGDGDPDLLAGNTFEWALWRNAGSASFVKDTAVSTMAELVAASLADLDGDGDLDLALARNPSHCDPGSPGCEDGIAVALGSGNGTWEEPTLFPVAGIPLAESLSASDLDRDGDLDLVAAFMGIEVGIETAARLEVLLNLGKGRFSPGGRLSLVSEFERLPLILTDLDGNDYPDVAFLSHGLELIWNRTVPPRAADLDRNGVPDACESRPFRRADLDESGKVDLTDAVLILRHLFQGGDAPGCEKASDANDDSKVDITDPVTVLGHLFQGRGPPPEPFEACGPDPTVDGLSCARFAPCAPGA